MNNPLIYIAWILATIFLCIGLGWAIGLGISAALIMIYAILVDCTNGIVIQINAAAKKISQ